VRAGDVAVANRLARLSRNTVHTIQLVEEFNRRGVHFRALDLGVDSRTPAGKMIIGVYSSFNQYERENNPEKSLAKAQGKHLGRPAGRDAEKLSKVAHALEKGVIGSRNSSPYWYQPRQCEALPAGASQLNFNWPFCRSEWNGPQTNPQANEKGLPDIRKAFLVVSLALLECCPT